MAANYLRTEICTPIPKRGEGKGKEGGFSFQLTIHPPARKQVTDAADGAARNEAIDAERELEAISSPAESSALSPTPTNGRGY